jgi:type I restriction enzyme R subunit
VRPQFRGKKVGDALLSHVAAVARHEACFGIMLRVDTSLSHLLTESWEAWPGCLTAKTLTANQIQFIKLIIHYLMQSGWEQVGQLYESPFTDGRV